MSYPKQLAPIYSSQSLLVETALRVSAPSFQAPMVICNNEHRFLVAEKLHSAGIKAESIILEPVGRNTAAAVAVTALSAQDADPDSILLVLPSDHIVGDSDAFAKVVAIAASAAEQDYLVTFGIEPERPHTGYGYIERGDPAPNMDGVYKISKFIEKPDEKHASQLIASGSNYWNAGMFMFKSTVIVEEFERYAPDILTAARGALAGAEADLDFLRLNQEAFAMAPSMPFDVAIMEKTKRGAVAPCALGWSDVGSWRSLWEALPQDKDGNVTSGDVLVHETRNSLIHSESNVLTAVVGGNDLIVATTPDAVLVATMDKAESVKDLVARMDQLGRSEHLSPAVIYRPWGHYQTLDQGEDYLVKRIVVKSGATLSLQYHHHRAEHWVVVNGVAIVTRDEETFELNPNESTYIPVGTVHRLQNLEKEPLVLIEVQTGKILSEEDIVRLEDFYGRSEST